MRIPRVLATVAAAGFLGLLTAAPAPAAGEQVTTSGVQSADGTVSLVAEVSPMPTPPLAASSFSASADGTDLRVQATPLLPSRAAVAFVVDASADGARALSGSGRSGAAGFLLQLPPSATTVVVADREPAAVVAGPSTGVAPGLTAVSGLRSTGTRDTVAAIDLALSKVPAWPAVTPVVVLDTSAADAGGTTAEALAQRLHRAHAVLAVVTTAGSADYWSQVAEATGGLAVATKPVRAINAFDQVADGLRARYVVNVARPVSGSEIDVKVGSGRTTVTLPPDTAGPPAAAVPSASEADDDGPGAGRIVLIVLVLLLVLGALAALGLLAARSRRSPAAPEPAPEEEPSLPYAVEVKPGVRMYEGADLFEPRASRDAREASGPAPKSTSRRTPRPRTPQTPQTPTPVVNPTPRSNGDSTGSNGVGSGSSGVGSGTSGGSGTSSGSRTSSGSGARESSDSGAWESSASGASGVSGAGESGSGASSGSGAGESSGSGAGESGSGASSGSGARESGAGSGGGAGESGSGAGGSSGADVGVGSGVGQGAGSKGDARPGQPPTAREVAEQGAALFRPRTAPDARPRPSDAPEPQPPRMAAETATTAPPPDSRDAVTTTPEASEAGQDEDDDAQRYFDIPQGPHHPPAASSS